MTTDADALARRMADRDLMTAFHERIMTRVLFVVLAHAQERTPVRTGTLRRSETTRMEPGGMAGFVGTNITYGPFIHERIPFFELGIEDSRAQIDQIMQEAGDDYLKAVAG